MAVIKKTLFAENLDRYQTFVTDTNPTSDYFKITELSDTFTGGKNAFLIQGSDYLVPDTLIKIEIKDSKGNIIYHEPGEGIVSSSVNGTEVVTEYYEGVSKVVAVHIYPDTAFGPATITILGELSTYNSNGLNSPIPLEWEGKYNVKWQRQINVNPSLANTTKIRFYRRPTATIVETLSPIYTIVNGLKVESNIVSSFANITLSKLDTFAGDVKRIKVYRTSEGDISDYDMIQDILLESKELLTSFNLTGSVISEAGLMTSEVLEKLWSYPTLTTQLTSSRIDNGVKLNGNGYFRYTSSLNLSENSVYEFGIDAFYSASTPSDMGIYVSGSNNGEVLVGTLNGITPTKNLEDSLFQFTLPLAEPTASLYLSQSQSEWHIGNLSLKLTQDTAFSPSEISFVTSMPTVVGNETYNFKFEFYDVNNNYVPVLVTKSALFSGGNNNIGGTLIFISASASSSLAQLNAVSSSISGTATLYSSSANTTIVTLSGSVSGSITTLSSSVSGSITILSGSVSGSITSLSSSVSGSITTLSGSVSGSITSLSSSVSGSITTLSSSVSASITSLSASVSQSVYQGLLTSFNRVQQLANGNFSGSFIGDNVIYSPVLGGQLGYFSTLFKVGQAPNSIYLDARQSPRKIFIGGASPGGGDTEMSGAYNNTNTSVYLDSAGKFSLGNKLSFDGSTLTVNGTINVTGGNAATDANAALYAANAAASASLSGSSALSAAQRAAASASISASAAQTFASAQALSAQQTAINVSAISASNAALSASAAFTNAKAVADSIANGSYSGGTLISANSIVSPVIAGANGYISNVFKVGNGGITLDGTNKTIYIGAGAYANANTGFYVSSTGAFSLKDQLTWDGTALSVRGTILATGGTFSGNITSTATISGGTISGGSITGGSISIGNNFSVSGQGTLTAVNANLSGIITAEAGNIGGFIIGNNSFITSGGKLKIDTQAPAILLYQAAGGAPKVEIAASDTLTSPGAANIWVQYSGDGGYVGTQDNRVGTSNTNTTTTDYYGTTSDAVAVNISGVTTFTVYTPDLYVSINGGTTTQVAGYSDYPPFAPRGDWDYYSSVSVNRRAGRAFFVLQLLNSAGTSIIAESSTIGSEAYMYGAYTQTAYQAVGGGAFGMSYWEQTSFTSNGFATARQAFALKTGTINIPSTGTYRVRMVLRIVATAGSVYDFNDNTYTYAPTTATSNHNYTGVQLQLTPNVNKVEITNGGIQIVTTSDSYVQMQRYDGGTWSGGTLIRAIGGNTTLKAFGAGSDYLTNQAATIEGVATIAGTSGNSIGSTTYESNPAPEITSPNTVLTINGRFSLTGSAKQSRVSVMANIYPYSDDRYDLGGTGYRWRDIYTNGNVNTSDKNKKFEIEKSSLGLDFINKLEPVSYKYLTGSVIYQQDWPDYIEEEMQPGEKDELGNVLTEVKIVKTPNTELPPMIGVVPGKRKHYGLIAQDVKAVLDEIGISTNDFAGYVDGNVEEDGAQLGLRYHEFISPMIKAIQQLSTKIDELEAKISGSV